MDAAATLTSVDTDPSVQAVAREFLGHDPRLDDDGPLDELQQLG